MKKSTLHKRRSFPVVMLAVVAVLFAGAYFYIIAGATTRNSKADYRQCIPNATCVVGNDLSCGMGGRCQGREGEVGRCLCRTNSTDELRAILTRTDNNNWGPDRKEAARIIRLLNQIVNNDTSSYTCNPSIFTDVSATDPYCTDITYVKTKGLMSGCSNNIFCGNDRFTRVQYAVVVQRLTHLGSPSVSPSDFTDLHPGNIFFNAAAYSIGWQLLPNEAPYFYPNLPIQYTHFSGILNRYNVPIRPSCPPISHDC